MCLNLGRFCVNVSLAQSCTNLYKDRHAYTCRRDLSNGANFDFLPLLIPKIHPPPPIGQNPIFFFFATPTPLALCNHNTNTSSEAKCDQMHYRKEFSTTLSLCIFVVSATLKRCCNFPNLEELENLVILLLYFIRPP